MKPLKPISKSDYPGLGLVVYCNHCKTNVTNCKGKSLEKCPHPEKHRYKQYIGIPGTKDRVTKTFEGIRNLKEAIQKALKFKKSLLENYLQQQEPEQPKEEIVIPTPQQEQPATPVNSNTEAPLFTEAASRYIGFLSADDNVPSYMKRQRSSDYVKEVERCFCRVAKCWNRSYDVASLRVDQVNREMVGQVYDYLQNEIKYSNRTLNKNIGFLNSLYSFLGKEGYNIHSPFASVIRKPVMTKIETITKEEFDKLLSVITRENGEHRTPGKKRKQRNEYRSWLIPSFKMAIECGRRREELTQIRWSDIIHDSNANPVCIKVYDIKVNNIRGVKKEEEKKIVYVPITEKLMVLLTELGYENNKNSNKYILAPDLKAQRGKVMCDTLSRSFAHYIKQIGTEKNLSFKCLRKTYITNLAIRFGNNTKMITGHSGNEVLQQHYIDPFEIAKSLRNFEVFGKEGERNSELKNIRENHKEKTIEIER